MRLIRLTLLVAMAITTALTSCEKPVPVEDNPVPELELTYNDLEGCWRLTHLNGVEIFDDTELFIEFDNAKLDNGKESHRYKMLDNIGSMYPRLTTGSYSLVTEEDGSYTISGSYDNGSGDWNEEYRVALFPGERLQWKSRTTTTCLDFIFAMEIPEEFNK